LTRKALELLKRLAAEQENARKKKGDTEETKDAEEDEADSEDQNDHVYSDASTVYDSFWTEFGKSIKLGLIDDRANKVALSKLLRYYTSTSDGKLRSLQDYIDSMKDKQNNIYYITGASLDAVKKSPFLEQLTRRGLEVIYMTDPLDEYVVQQLVDFDGKKLMSATKEGLKFGDENQKQKKRLDKEFKPLTDWLKNTYGDKVEEVVVSHRIQQSPAVLVTSQYGWSANMERIMKAQTFSNQKDHMFMMAKKTMEINPYHPLVRELGKRADATPEDKQLLDAAQLLFDSALLVSGFHMDEPDQFANRIHRVMSIGLNVDPDAPVEQPEFAEDSADSADDAEDESDGDTGSNNMHSSGDPEVDVEEIMKKLNLNEHQHTDEHDEL